MDEYSSLSPEQMLMLQRYGLLYGGAPENYSGGFSGQSDGLSVSGGGLTASKTGAEMNRGGMNVVAPFDGGSLGLGVNAFDLNTARGQTTQVNPNATLQLGPFNAMYGQQYQNGQKVSDNYGIGYEHKVGPVGFTYMRSQGTSGPSMNTYGINADILDKAQIMANMTRGSGMPTQYQGGVNIPGLLGGDFSAAGQYTPDLKDKSIYAKWQKRF